MSEQPSDRNDRIDLTKLTLDVGEWAEENFGDRDDILESITERNDPGADLGALFTVLGVNEEAGELTHSVLKRAQGIRLDEDGVGREAEVDAVGDIIVYLADFCNRRGYDLEECVRRAWDGEVAEREWDSETRPDDPDPQVPDHPFVDVPDNCPNCGGYADHWAKDRPEEPSKVGWECPCCGASDEWTVDEGPNQEGSP